MNKTKIYALLSGVFCSCLIISNILAFKTFTILNITLPAAVIVFPIVYITNDILSEVYGYNNTRIVIILGFIMNLVAVLSYNIAIMLPYNEYFTGQESFELVLSNSGRILVASLIAYLIGGLLNAKIMEHMKKYSRLYERCIVSTFVGESVDAFIFVTIAFIGKMPPSAILILIINQAMFKTIYEIICYPITKLAIKKISNV